jgi:hypothetical protein
MFVDDPDPETNDAQRMYTGFTNDLIRWDNMAMGTFRASLVPSESLASSIRLQYGRHLPSSRWSGEIFCTPESSNIDDVSDRADYIAAMEFTKKEYRIERALRFTAPDIWDPLVADILLRYHCDLVRRRRVIVEFETYANAFNLEPGHVIKFDDEIADRVAFPGEGSGSWSNHQFNVVHTSVNKGVGQLARVFVRALEVYATP